LIVVIATSEPLTSSASIHSTAAPNSFEPETAAQWTLFHANITQRHSETTWSTEHGTPDTSIQDAYNQVQAINARVIGAEKSAGVLSGHTTSVTLSDDDESEPDKHNTSLSNPLLPAPNIVDGNEDNVMGLNPDELRRKLLEYLVEPVLIQRGEDAMELVCFCLLCTMGHCSSSYQEADGTFTCHKCARFLHKPEIANHEGFTSRHNLH
jgi:hypothetical protein